MNMQVKLLRWVISGLLVVLSYRLVISQTPTMMTREQAAQIALQFAQVGRYPGTLHWLTTDSLPAKQEVPEWDRDLIARLAAQGDNWNATMGEWDQGWFADGFVYLDTYYFQVTFDQFPGRLAAAKVNAWTGYCMLESFRGYKEYDDETNDDLGLGGYPVKTYEELQDIAVNIAKKLLGEGSYDILTVPYTPDKQQILADFFWGFIIFKVDPNTGAHLPQMVELWINSRTGWLEKGCLWNRPLTVSTKPLISKDKAKKLAEQYLASLGITVTGWLEDGFYGGEIIHKCAFPTQAVVGLYVFEDALLEQHLVWSLIFTWTKDDGSPSCDWVRVNALTGDVKMFGSQSLDLMLLKRKRVKPRGKLDVIERSELYFNEKWVELDKPMLHFNGRLFISVDYVDNLGARWDGSKLEGRKGKVQIREKERFYYRGRLYLPLCRICEVSGIRLWWDNKRKVPVLRSEWLEVRRWLAQRR